MSHQVEKNKTLLRYITMFCGTNNIPSNIPGYFLHLVWMWKIFREIFLVPHKMIVNLNNVTNETTSNYYFPSPPFFVGDEGYFK